jgi:broad specificity phosphatase PhoE
VQTAEVLHGHLPQCSLTQNSKLRERHLGVLQGRLLADVDADHPGLQILAGQDEQTPLPGGGESLADLLSRAKAAALQLGHEHKGEHVKVAKVAMASGCMRA